MRCSDKCASAVPCLRVRVPCPGSGLPGAPGRRARRVHVSLNVAREHVCQLPGRSSLGTRSVWPRGSCWVHGEPGCQLGLRSAWYRQVWQSPMPTAAAPGCAGSSGALPRMPSPLCVLGGRIHLQLHTCSASSCPAPQALISVILGSGSAHLPATLRWCCGKQGGTWQREWDRMSPVVLLAQREPGRAQQCQTDKENIIQ